MVEANETNFPQEKIIDIVFALIIIIVTAVSYTAGILYGGNVAPRPSTEEIQWVWYSFDGYVAFPLGTGMIGLSFLGFLLPVTFWTTFLIYLKLRMKISFGKGYWALLFGTLIICSYAMRSTWTGSVYMLDIGPPLILLLGVIIATISKWNRPGLYSFIYMTAIWYGIAFWDIIIGTRYLTHGSGCIGGVNNGIGDGLWFSPFYIAMNMLVFSIVARYLIHSSSDDQEDEDELDERIAEESGTGTSNIED